MILTTNIDIAVDYNEVVPKKKAFPKSVTGPQNIEANTTAIYKIIEYNNETGLSPADQIDFDNDKNNIKWSFWIESPLMTGIADNIIITDKTLINDSLEDFTLIPDKTSFKSELLSKGFLEATTEIIEENGKKINKLSIKFSKWLDGKNIYIEPYRGKADHDVNNTYVTTTVLEAAPEITNIYWVSTGGNNIGSAGFNSSIKLCIESLGLQQQTINISLHDHDEGNPDDLIKWNGNLEYLSYTVSSRRSLIPYEVESYDSPAYSSAFGDETDGVLEVYVKVDYNGSALADNEGPINFTSVVQGTPYFASRNEVIINNSTQISYNKITSIFPGQTAYLVAHVVNFSGEVSFSVYESEPLLATPNEKLPLITDEDQNTDFVGTVTDNFVAVEVKFQELDSATYNQWLQLLFPQDGTIEESSLSLKLTIESQEFTSVDLFKIAAPYVAQRIYHDGFISNGDYIQLIIRKVQFLYITEGNAEYNFGLFDLVWAQRWIKGSKTSSANVKKVVSGGKTRYYTYDGSPGVNKTPLVTILNTTIPNNTRHMFEYYHNNIRIIRLSEDTSREYFNPKRLAAILGAIISTGYIDIVTNGSVGTDGTGAYSVSHVNGNNVDFKYLRTDANRPRIDMVEGVIYTNASNLDKSRQNTLMNAFHTFGFGVTRLNLSDFLADGTLLDFCEQDKNGDHKDHLHIQGFQPNYR